MTLLGLIMHPNGGRLSSRLQGTVLRLSVGGKPHGAINHRKSDATSLLSIDVHRAAETPEARVNIGTVLLQL